MSRVQVVLPGSIDDPARPSGGNVYDRRLCRELSTQGWSVFEHRLSGDWPTPSPRDRSRLADLLAQVPGGEVVLLDGLLATPSADALLPHADRLGLVVLVHQLLVDGMPAAAAVHGHEAAVLRAAQAVVVTSGWSRDRALLRHRLDPSRLHVAEPGTDPAPPARGSADGSRLLCVGVVAPHKGQDVLLAALDEVTADGWDCTLVGSLDRDPEFVAALEGRAGAADLGTRVRFTGALPHAHVADRYARSDLLVVPSRAESYGMVATEALAHGLPVLASDVGGLPEALGRGSAAGPAGLLVPPGDALALASALRAWLREPDLRERLRARAGRRRQALPTWGETARSVAAALRSAQRPAAGERRG